MYRILIVEDDPSIAELLKMNFTVAGFQTETASLLSKNRNQSRRKGSANAVVRREAKTSRNKKTMLRIQIDHDLYPRIIKHINQGLCYGIV